MAFGLMVMDRYDARLVERARLAVMDGVTPVLDLISQPADAIAEMVATADQLANLRVENERLRLENERLQTWRQAANHLEMENLHLRALTNLTPDPGVSFVTARAVADPGGAYVRSLLVNAGSDVGVARGQAAITGSGLAGRVLQAGERSARVLLITDINSRIPVTVGRGREAAVLGGDNSALPRVLYLGPESTVAVGDYVTTSGHGGALPPGLPVGRVVSVDEQAGVRVRPFVERGKLRYLRLVAYDLPDQLANFSSGEGGRP